MLNMEITKLLNEQINKELYSAYLYMDMANYYADQGLNGFENWFFVQTQEERDHAMLFRQYLLNNGESVKELLARSRYLLFKFKTAWTDSQAERAKILFEMFRSEITKEYCVLMNENTL